MSITIPGLRRDKRTPRHRAVDEVVRLRHELEGAGHFIAELQQKVTDAQAAADKANAKAGRVDEAEAYAKAAKAELAELRAFKANVTAVTVPAGHRDIAPGDRPTQPVRVRALWDAHGIGPVTTVTDPGLTTT